MPNIRIAGLGETLKSLRVFSPNALKEYRTESRTAAKLVQRVARSKIKTNPPMSGWRKTAPIKPRGTPRPHPRARTMTTGWPAWDSRLIKSKITIETRPERQRGQSWASLLRIVNGSRSGAIFEVAGRKKIKTSKSGKQFIANLDQRNEKASRGIYRAYDENEKVVVDAVQKAINKAIAQFERDIAAQTRSG